MDLSRFQRLLLSNQLRILEQVDPERADYYAEKRKVFEWGFELAYDWKTENIHKDTVSADDCTFVLDVMSMYEHLQRAHKKHNPSEVNQIEVTFSGFDGNQESGLYSFTNFLVEDQGKYEYLSLGSDGLNSHMPMRSAYERMVEAWEESEDKYNLSEQDLERIVQAGVHPSQRDE